MVFSIPHQSLSPLPRKGAPEIQLPLQQRVTAWKVTAKANQGARGRKTGVIGLRFAAILGAMCAQMMVVGVAAADVPKALVRGDMPQELREAILRAVGEAKQPPASRLEARRRAQDAGEDAIAVLRSAGYYAYVVEPSVGDGTPAQPIVQIFTGPQFTIAVPKVTWLGAPPPPPVQAAGETALALKEGAPGRAADLLAAEGRVVAAVQKKGYADAQATSHEIIVDHDSSTVIPEFKVNSGGEVHLDGIDLRTQGRTNPVWVRQLAPWTQGDVYDPDDVAELERRLLDAQVYESVTVALAPADQAIDGNRPVLVSLAERPRRLLELGAGYSTTEGAGLDGRSTWYNRLGRADTLTATFRLAQIERKLLGEISLPHWRKAQRTLHLSSGIYQQNTDAYDETGVNAEADITKRYSKTTYRTFGLSIDLTKTDEHVPVDRTRTLQTLTGLSLFAWDKSDDPLNPRHGFRLEGRLEPTFSTGDDTLIYLRAIGQASAYLPLGREANTVFAGRLKLGSVAGGSLAAIPSSRRLYAGGGGSVRGYAYQGVGPRLTDNTPQGGLGLFEASFEARQHIKGKWGAVAFIDVGAISDSETPDFSNVNTGVGVGVRYDLGFGPIRADLAIPIDKRTGDSAYEIYLSIGQSF
jgi:translocation and assembly module TamA